MILLWRASRNEILFSRNKIWRQRRKKAATYFQDGRTSKSGEEKREVCSTGRKSGTKRWVDCKATTHACSPGNELNQRERPLLFPSETVLQWEINQEIKSLAFFGLRAKKDRYNGYDSAKCSQDPKLTDARLRSRRKGRA